MPESGNQNYWQQEPASSEVQPSTSPQPSAAPESSTTSEPSPPIGFPSASPVAPDNPAPPAANAPDPTPHESQFVFDWDAPEFIEQPKGPLWFVGFALFGVTLLAVSILLLKDWFVTGGFVIMIVSVMAITLRRPRTVRYQLDEDGVHVGERLYAYTEFQSFALQQEGSIWNVVFTPTARFKPALLIYFHQDQGEDIVDALGHYLPMEEHKTDLFDRLASKIRF